MSKQIHVDFYHVETSDGTPGFGTILGRISRLTPEEQKNVEIGDGHIIRLHDYVVRRQFHEANMVRIRMNQVPVRASTAGALNPIVLADDEGVGEQTLLMYNPRLKVIGIQRNRYGVSAAAAAYYVRRLAGIEETGDLLAQPILEPDIIEKMERLTQIRSLDVRVAGIVNPKVFGSQVSGYTATAMNRLMTDFKAPTVAVSLSVGRRRNETISLDHAKEALRTFLGMRREHEGSVTRLQVRGRDEDGDIEIINMLRAQMSESVDVESEGRDVPLEERRRAIDIAFDRRSIELNRMYKEPG